MDNDTRRRAAREELLALLFNTMEQAQDLAIARLPKTAGAIARHYQRLEGASYDATSLATALRLLDQGRSAINNSRKKR